MKKYILLLNVLFGTSCFFSQNGANISYKISSTKGVNGDVILKVGEFGSLSEFNMVVPQMPGGGIYMKHLVKKSRPGIIYSINDKNKTYSESNPTDPANQDTKTYAVKKLGEETVNGYKCVHALVTEGAETHEVWNTRDIPEFSKYSEAFSSNKKVGSQRREEALKAAGCDGLPVKTLHKGNPREGDMTMELVKFEKKTFTRSEFEVPEGYSMTATGNQIAPDTKSQQELMNMTPEERARYVEEMKKKYGAK
jgi:hypothetical protein